MVDRATRAQIVFCGCFCAILVASAATGSKIIEIGPFTASAAVIAYALTFPITDTVAEVFGKQSARFVVLSGFIAIFLGTALFQIAIYAPAASFYESQDQFESIFNFSIRFFIGGVVAYLISQQFDIYFFHLLKTATSGRHLWLRNNLSTAVSQLIDTTIFVLIAFLGVVDNIISLIVGQYLAKLCIAVLDTPLVYLTVRRVRNYVGYD